MSSDPTPDVAPIPTEVLPNSVPEAATPRHLPSSNGDRGERNRAIDDGAAKVRLNPTVDPEQDKAIPYTSATALEADKLTAEIAAEEAATGPDRHFAPSATSVPKAEPIEIPNKRDVALDPKWIRRLQSSRFRRNPGCDCTPASSDAHFPVRHRSSRRRRRPEPGYSPEGKYRLFAGENVILDVGMRSSGCFPASSSKGSSPKWVHLLDVVVDATVLCRGPVMCSLPSDAIGQRLDEVQVGQIVGLHVTKDEQGGLEVTVNALRGSCRQARLIRVYRQPRQLRGQETPRESHRSQPEKKNLVSAACAFLESNGARSATKCGRRRRGSDPLRRRQNHQGIWRVH